MPETSIQERLGWPPDPQLHERIRRLWIRHSIAEDKRDLEGLISTLTPDCVYEIPATGQRWEGHDGARTFYTTFLGAFPDVHFALTDIVVGPQGVFEVADMTGTHLGDWAGMPPTGQPVRLQILIYFPWHRAAEKFAGEKIFFDRKALEAQTA
jgi:predicted ester cyclase